MIKKGDDPLPLFSRGIVLRVARTSTAPPEGCTHIDEVLSAAPPDVEGSTLQAHFVLLLDGVCPPQVDTWTRVALEPYRGSVMQKLATKTPKEVESEVHHGDSPHDASR